MVSSSSFYTSFIFLTNCLFAFSKRRLTYALAFYTLTMTSIVVHGIYSSLATVILDRLAISNIVMLGSYHLLKTRPSRPVLCCIASTFIIVAWTYFYGYFTNQFCFSTNLETASYCNSFIHVVSSLGHHLIISTL